MKFSPLTTTSRITLSLVAISLTTLLSAHLIGLIPSERDAILKGRSHLCESIAIQFSVFAVRNDNEAMETSLQAIVERNPDIRSVGLRRSDGLMVVSTPNHAEIWTPTAGELSTETQMYVPIFEGAKQWGTVEVQFSPPGSSSWIGQHVHPLIALCAFFVLTTFAIFGSYLRRVLTLLNPSKVVPHRVRTALDTLSEGLLLLDSRGRIVHANQSFTQTTGCMFEQLIGKEASSLPWTEQTDSDTSSTSSEPSAGPDSPPWVAVLQGGEPQRGRILSLASNETSPKTFSVSASPISDDQGNRKGAIASFEEISHLEQKKNELSIALQSLRLSSEKVREQNAVLERLATRDPLTNCFNRRALFEQFDALWNSTKRYGHTLATIMIDIDHFKAVNDTHGHSVGDQVLQKFAEVLKQCVRQTDVIARYGGEEFAILLPNTNIQNAVQLADRIREAVAACQFPQLSITASLGVSALCQQPDNPQNLLEQADRCLYIAKRTGRNRVVRHDRIPTGSVADQSKEAQARSGNPTSSRTIIPFPAVTALISALGYRDPSTAAHSRRVADLCVEVAHGLMSMSQCYILETAALLHDIGKIGVPDSILLKPDRLNDEEWAVMHKHERIGLEIIRASFASQELSQIVENYRRHFDGRDKNLGPTGTHIPLGARILAVADAFDSMTSERSYRAAMSPNEAFEELRKFSNTQFDAAIVHRFIDVIRRQKSQQVSTSSEISKETALGIGLEMERLAEAVDQQDIDGLGAMAGRLAETAARSGAPEIAAKSIELEQAAIAGGDVLGVIQRACELIDYCRATQSTFLKHAVSNIEPTRRAGEPRRERELSEI